KMHDLEHKGSCDTSYSFKDSETGETVARFRVASFHSRSKLALVMRRIVTQIPRFNELNLPPQIEQLANIHRGLILVSGTTEIGKSTSLAAIIGKIGRAHV